MRAITVHQYGGPDVLTDEDVPERQPGPGEALVRHEAIGVNFIDIYQRRGFYPGSLPFTAGNEGAGRIEAVGPGVRAFLAGDRVAYAMVPGAYAERAIVPAARMVRLPGDIDAPTAAALMLQGLTAHYLTHSVFPLKPGDTMVVHAAAGGLGLLLVQVGKRIGATVIGLTSTLEKARAVEDAGADLTVLSTKSDFEADVHRATGGRGADVVYDSVGKDTFRRSLDCLRPRGYLVLVGQAGGPVPPIEISLLAKRSLFFTRPGLAHYIATHDELVARASEVFEWHRSGALRVRIDRTLPLSQATDAHRRLESRESAGKILLVP
jgi:NADPH2:quinone reductase